MDEWKIYRVCSEIPDHDRKNDLGAFFKSIHGTLNHILYGDKAWMGRFIKEPFTVKIIGQELYEDFEELRGERLATDQQILLWTQNLSSEWLQTPFEYTSNIDGKTRILPTWTLVTHMFNHQTHHRGQVTTLIKQLGYEPGITDIPWLPEFEEMPGSNP
ncbi:MAG: DinB family protein [Leptolyngbyaceae bacterium]|nr:DinB family protein [Leptolyngbyaceae bacterium]